MTLTAEDRRAMAACGITEEQFIAARQQEIAEKNRRAGKTRNVDGLSADDEEAMRHVGGITREDFLRERAKERGTLSGIEQIAALVLTAEDRAVLAATGVSLEAFVTERVREMKARRGAPAAPRKTARAVYLDGHEEELPVP